MDLCSTLLVEAMANQHQVVGYSNQFPTEQQQQLDTNICFSTTNHEDSFHNNFLLLADVELNEKKVISRVSCREKQEKKCRKSFAVEQLLALEYQYAQSKYLRGMRRLQLANQLNLTDAQVKIWFQNRRAKDNRNVTSTIIQTTQPQHVQTLNLHRKLDTSSSCDSKSNGESLFLESHALNHRLNQKLAPQMSEHFNQK